MRKAYIILVHAKPVQLARLIDSLADGSADFFVHLDKACDSSSFKRILSDRSRCHLIPRENGAWGRIGIVKAVLNGLRAVTDFGCDFGIVNVISGQDYPLRSSAYIDLFFEKNRDKIFIEHFPLPSKYWTNLGLDRIHNYHFGDRRRRSRRIASRWISRVFNSCVLLRRKHPAGLCPFGGSDWWSIPMTAAREILKFVDVRPDFLRFHKSSYVPSEMFLNSFDETLRSNLVNNCLRFVDWDNPNPNTPATITEKYFRPLIASKCLFGRKFDIDLDQSILGALDRYRLEEEREIRAQQASGTVQFDMTRSEDFPNSPACAGTKVGLFSGINQF
jgi:hypothetical protein